MVVLQWLLNRLAYSLQAGKVDTGIKLVLVKYLLQTLAVTDVNLVERNLLANNLGNTLQRNWA